MPPKSASRGIKKSTSRSKPKKASHSSQQTEAALTAATTFASEPQDSNSPIFFWKPHQTGGYLSQWYETPWSHDGATYTTAEMWMMVGKAKLFDDEKVAKLMLATSDPKAHKRLGRQVTPFDPKIWDKEKMRIVEEGNWWKFTKSEGSPEMRKWLLDTGDRELVEASPMDRIWGIGFGEKNAENNRHKWGKNLLGKALMNVRNRLREEESNEGI